MGFRNVLRIIIMMVMCTAFGTAEVSGESKNEGREMSLTVKRLPCGIAEAKSIGETFDKFRVEWNEIGYLNWERNYPYKPDARFRIAHDGRNIYVEYRVSEGAVRAMNDKDQSPVFQDACCEFFLKLNGEDTYYNIESNCIGAILMQAGVTNTNREEADEKVLGSIKRWSSLGKMPFDTRIGEHRWSLTLIIPASALFKSNVKSLDGMEATANFFKYGSRLPKRHFMSWNRVGQEGKPNFHQTGRFGKVKFE